MLKPVLSLLAACVLAGALSACDAVRYPGDGGEAPRTPASRDPDGPPGPPPPSTPVENPYGDGVAEPVEPEQPVDVSQPVDNGTPSTPAGPGDQSGDPSDPVDGGEPVQPSEPAQPPVPVEPVFSYYAPGQLIAGSGTGAPDQIVHAPDIVFPIKSAPAYLQSMVWNHGGGVVGGDECDARNFAYPWRDNFCETRSSNRNSPLCPVARIHQGQDIRVGTPQECRILRGTPEDERTLHEVVAVEDGVVYEIGTYTVKLRAGGRTYRYMHMNMDALQVSEGDTVEAGDVLGYVSKDFGGTPTTFHLHFEIIQNTEEHGWVHVPPYLSLVEAYERREAGFGEEVEAPVVTSAIAPPPDLVIVE